MSKSLISTGITPNDGNGDTLLAGANKVNSNFNEIYSSLGNGSDLNIGVGKTVISTDDFGNIGIGTVSSSEKLTVQGNILASQISASTITLSIEGTIPSVRGDNLYYDSANIVSGVITSISGNTLNYSGIVTGGSYSIGSTQVVSSGRELQNILSLDSVTTATIESAIQLAPNNFNDLNVTGISTLQSTSITNLTGTAATITAVNSTNGSITNLTGTAATITAVNSTNGSITNLTGTAATITTFLGTAATITTLNTTDGSITNLTGTAATITIFAGTAATITTLNTTDGSITNLSGNELSYNGISTFSSGPVLISHTGTATSTGTSSQPLQVLGGSYVSENLGVGVTNPTSKLEVVGDTFITGDTLITGITTVGLGTTSTPPANSQLSFELTSNTNLRIKVRGTDGVLRSADITLS